MPLASIMRTLRCFIGASLMAFELWGGLFREDVGRAGGKPPRDRWRDAGHRVQEMASGVIGATARLRPTAAPLMKLISSILVPSPKVFLLTQNLWRGRPRAEWPIAHFYTDAVCDSTPN